MEDFNFDEYFESRKDIAKSYRVTLYRTKMNKARAQDVLERVRLGNRFKLKIEMKSFKHGYHDAEIWTELVEITEVGFVGKILNKPSMVWIHDYKLGSMITYEPQNIIGEQGYRDHEPKIPEGY